MAIAFWASVKVAGTKTLLTAANHHSRLDAAVHPLRRSNPRSLQQSTVQREGWADGAVVGAGAAPPPILTETIDSSVAPEVSRTVRRMAYSPGARPDVDQAPRVPFTTEMLHRPIVRHAPSGPRHSSV